MVLRIDPANSGRQLQPWRSADDEGQGGRAPSLISNVFDPASTAARFNLFAPTSKAKRSRRCACVATDVSQQGKYDVQVHFSLGVLLASEKQYKPAQLELEKADALQPETFEILYNLGQVYLRDGQNAKAEIALNARPEA